MSLNSLKFLISFGVLFFVLAVFQSLCKRFKREIINRVQVIILAIYSYFFLCCSDYRFGICIAITTLIAYFTGVWLSRTKNIKNKKVLMILGVSLCATMLGYFKYCNFFIDSLCRILGKESPILHILVPIGVSFYTFTAISYIVDVYNEKCGVERNIINFSFFIACFTKVTAGPIVKGRDFLPQIRNYQGINFLNVSEGIQIFALGLFKKIVLADRLAVFVDDVFFAPMAYNTGTVILAVFSYSLQIYFDFSGYSDMAIGLSKILGFNFNRNFNLPYIAENISDFWKRWHISLSGWLQEYVYIPLGGSYKGTIRTYINLILTMLIGGLWHGAGYTYILWGLMYGIANCIHRFWKQERKQNVKNSICRKAFRVVGTFSIVSLFWVMFRASDLDNAVEVYRAMFTVHTGISQPYTWSFFASVCLIVATVLAIIKAQRHHENYVNGFYPIMDLSKFWNLVVFFTFVGLTIMMGYFGDTAFIYGKF